MDGYDVHRILDTALPPLPVDAGCDEQQRRHLLADVLDGILLHPVLLGLLHRLDSSAQE